MSSIRNKVEKSLGDMQTISDFRYALKQMKKEFLLKEKKLLLKNLCSGFARLTVLLEQKQSGIHPIVISWFELYIKLLKSINAEDNKLLQQYEKTVPSAISYIIGCIQYSPKDNFTFDFRLLEILDTLLQSILPNVVKGISTLSNGTIACLWKPIRFAGDFNTQTLALNIFAKLLRSFDTKRVESELKSVKWSSISLFKDKLLRVIKGSSRLCDYENDCRELLNNFNKELTRNIFIYSLECESVVIGGNEFEFKKPLVMENFWVDLNFRPKTISFKGRHMLKMDYVYQDFDVNLKWRNIQLKNDHLFIAIEKTKDSVLPSKISAKLKKHDNLILYLTDKEMQSFKNNKDVMQYTGLMETKVNAKNTEENAPKIISPGNSNNNANMLKSPVTCNNNSLPNEKQNNTPKRKFFTAIREQTKKKNSNKKLSKILKPKTERKSVCKVVPVVVDLTKTPEHIETRPRSSILYNRMGGTNGKLTAKQCLKILNTVSDTNKPQETYCNYDKSDDDQYQFNSEVTSFVNFAAGITERTKNTNPGARNGETLAKHDKPFTVCPPKTEFNRFKNSNGCNNVNISRPQNGTKRKAFSQDMFDQLKDEGNISSRPSKRSRQCSKENVSTRFKNSNGCNNVNISIPQSGTKRKLFSQDIFDQLKDEGNISSGSSKMPRQCSRENIKTENKLCLNNSQGSNDEYLSDEILGDLTNMCSTPLRRSTQLYPKTPPSVNNMDVSGINNTLNEIDTSDHFLLKKPRTENKITNYSLFGADNDVSKKAFIDDQIHIETKNDQTKQLAKQTNYSPIHTGAETCKPKDCIIYKKRLESDDSESENENELNYEFNSFAEVKTKAATNLNPEIKETALKEVANKDKVLQTISQTKAVAQQPEINTTGTVLYNSYVKSILAKNDTHNKKQVTLYFQSLCRSLLPNHDINEKNQKIYGSKIVIQAADKNIIQQSLQQIQPEKNKEYKSIEQSAHVEDISTKSKSLINKAKEFLTNTTDVVKGSHESVNREPYLNVKESQLLSNDPGSLNLMLEEKEYMKKELYEMKQHYFNEIENVLNFLRPQYATETFTATKFKMCALVEKIVKQSNEHRKELELLQATIQRLVLQMECQYELYVKRNEQFQCFQESSELILDTFACLSLQSDISNKYHDVIDKLNVAELNICKEIWQKCFAAKKQNLMKTIDSLSEI